MSEVLDGDTDFSSIEGVVIQDVAAESAVEPPAGAATLDAAPEPSAEQPKVQTSEPQDVAPEPPARSRSFHAPEGSQNKEIVMTELKAMKISSINARNAALEADISCAEAKLEETTKALVNPAAETVKNHIKLLHDYNDIRDVGQGLIGMIADGRGVRIGELYDEFGVGLKD